MNILVLSHRVPYPANKGEKIRTYNQLCYFVKNGYNVTIATPLEDQSDSLFAQQLQEKLGVHLIKDNLGLRYPRMLSGLLKNKPLSVTNFYSKKLQTGINQHISNNSIDAIMCTSSAMAEYIFNERTKSLVEENANLLVMDFMDLDSRKWEQYSSYKPWPMSLIYKREAILLGKMEAEIIDTFDEILFVSYEEKRLCEKNGPENPKIHAVTNGVDTKAYYPSAAKKIYDENEDRPLTFLFTGVMDYFPNEQAVLWFAEIVWPEIMKNYRDAKFVIAGMRPSQKVTDLSKQTGIEVTGFVDDILPYYQQADFMVAPFRLARGIQNKVLQAMACGLPVITSVAGADGIHGTPGTHFIVAEEKNDYLSAIDHLLKDPDRYNHLREAALEFVESEYSWDTQNSKLVAILKKSDIVSS